jgi:glycosyltransferase involved in cell wall biosynthesis
LRILQVSSARAFGGGERHLADLARGLAARGHEVFAALSPSSPLLDKLGAIPDSNILKLPLRNALDLASASRLARFAREKRVEIIHAHVARDYTLAAFAARRANAARLVLTRHVLFPLSRVHRLTLSNVSRVVAVSEAVARALRAQSIFPADRIRVVANGIDLRRFDDARAEVERESRRFDSSQHPPQSGTPRRPLRVGIVGELSEVKGQENFVRAVAVVAGRFNEEVEFVIVGEDESRSGEYRARVERLISELNLAGRVRLMGRLEDVAGVVASFDVFVSASNSEAFGVAMVEAMACAVPVVATATMGAREIVEDGATGLIVAVGDTGALAAAVVSLLEDEARRLALGARSRDAARERFSLERMIEATERVYAEAIGRAPGASP